MSMQPPVRVSGGQYEQEEPLNYIDDEGSTPTQEIEVVAKPSSNEFVITYDSLDYGFYQTRLDKAWAAIRGRQSLQDKHVLRGVSGHFACGEMTALMGTFHGAAFRLMSLLQGLPDPEKHC